MSTKTILGLDLGVGSIGWALVKYDSEKEKHSFLDMGARVIPLTTDSKNEFEQGKAISINQQRTIKRTLRKRQDRYQQRRRTLKSMLKKLGMMPDKTQMLQMTAVELYGLRDRALKEPLRPTELGRVFLHLNQRRGYKSAKDDYNDNERSNYLQAVNNRHATILEAGLTIGQFFYQNLVQDPHYRIKEEVYPRSAYMAEFDQVWAFQSQFEAFKNLLTPENKKRLRDEILYYQRPLKSQKGLVSTCHLEGFETTGKDGKKRLAGPKATPRSNPLFQVEKLWESIHNIRVQQKGKRGEVAPTMEQKEALFAWMNANKSLTEKKLFEIMGLKKKDGYKASKQLLKGLQGNETLCKIKEVLDKGKELGHWLQFQLRMEHRTVVDKHTGEAMTIPVVGQGYEKEPLYQLWHTLYAIEDTEILQNTLTQKLGLPEAIATDLVKIDLKKPGYGHKSAKAIRKLLPQLMAGHDYAASLPRAGYAGQITLTKEEEDLLGRQEKLELLPKNSLRQPVVEKILNQMVHLVNAIIDKHGKPDEIRVELARELKSNVKDRNRAWRQNGQRERDRKTIIKRLEENAEFRKKRVSNRDIERYRLWEEFDRRSPYEPDKPISLSELYGGTYEIEHILPKSLFFDDSFMNKTICPSHLNAGREGKNNLTAYDFMQQQGPEAFEKFLNYIHKTYDDGKILKTKLNRLLTTKADIPDDFVDRQLRQSQYIARASVSLLKKICASVHTTSGGVTAFLRQTWGWDEVLQQLNLPKYRELGLTEQQPYYHVGQEKYREVVPTWHKRDDHRHHAIDALVVACTQQGFIQRINNLNKQDTQAAMRESLAQENGHNPTKARRTLLERYMMRYQPFKTHLVCGWAECISISYKAGKKVAKHGKRFVKQRGNKPALAQKEGLWVPQGPLSKETVYGKRPRRVEQLVKLDGNFDKAHQILTEELRSLVMTHLAHHNNDPEKAFANLRKDPVLYQGEKVTKVAIWDYEDTYVIKRKVTDITTAKQLKEVMDDTARARIQTRWDAAEGNVKKAYENLSANPIYLDEAGTIPIRTVRCYTDVKLVAPIYVEDPTDGTQYTKYVVPGNNHHIAIYENEKGKRKEHVTTFWHAVRRKMYGVPVIIKDTAALWDEVLATGIDDQDFLSQLPLQGWRYVTSMQENELFVFHKTQEELEAALSAKDYAAINPHLYRVRKLSAGAFWFNQQYETTPRESMTDKKAGRCIQASLSSMTGIKVRVSLLGEISMAD